MKKLAKKATKNSAVKAYYGNCTCTCSSNLYNNNSMYNGTGY